MGKLFSNGPNKDFVRTIFEKLESRSSELYLAAPYFNYDAPILRAIDLGKTVQLLVGLNAATSPGALTSILGRPGVFVRYFTDRYHAKIYLFDDAALVGSANLTDAGMNSNREAVIHLNSDEDQEAIDEVRALFSELWSDASVLTPDKLKVFASIIRAAKPGPNIDAEIENALGKAVPKNINSASHKPTREQLFSAPLQRRVYEEYLPAFLEVRDVLSSSSLHRPELIELGVAHATNRFLNWVRLTQAPGEIAWKATKLCSSKERRHIIIRLGQEWLATNNSLVLPTYVEQIAAVTCVFETSEAVSAASKDDFSEGLLGLHAFIEQLRFVKGGQPNLIPTFWHHNDDDEKGVKEAIAHLLHGSGDFIRRLHDLLYDKEWKVAYFGLFCALELYGTVKPDEFPPINGRMAKALRYIGFDVRG